jgi:hypothetical protein
MEFPASGEAGATAIPLCVASRQARADWRLS